jgi:hypothetical protein
MISRRTAPMSAPIVMPSTAGKVPPMSTDGADSAYVLVVTRSGPAVKYPSRSRCCWAHSPTPPMANRTTLTRAK